MTADDKREQMEALLWREVQEPGLVGRILAASAAVEKAAAREAVATAREPKAEASAAKAPAVHFPAPADKDGRYACRAWDWGSSGWLVSDDPQAVTCGRCRKTPAWQQATAGRGPGVVHFAGGGGRWSCRPWDMVMSGTVSLASGDVTCGNCRRTPGWRQAEAEGRRPEWAVALDELLGSDP